MKNQYKKYELDYSYTWPLYQLEQFRRADFIRNLRLKEFLEKFPKYRCLNKSVKLDPHFRYTKLFQVLCLQGLTKPEIKQKGINWQRKFDRFFLPCKPGAMVYLNQAGHDLKHELEQQDWSMEELEAARSKCARNYKRCMAMLDKFEHEWNQWNIEMDINSFENKT